MAIEELIAQVIGFFYGLTFSVFVVIYMKLRERLAKLEWSQTEKPNKKKKPKAKEA